MKNKILQNILTCSLLAVGMGSQGVALAFDEGAPEYQRQHHEHHQDGKEMRQDRQGREGPMKHHGPTPEMRAWCQANKEACESRKAKMKAHMEEMKKERESHQAVAKQWCQKNQAECQKSIQKHEEQMARRKGDGQGRPMDEGREHPGSQGERY